MARDATVLRIWEQLQGIRLSPATRRRFLSRPDAATLGMFSDEVLSKAGEMAMTEHRDGHLLLHEWLRHANRLDGESTSSPKAVRSVVQGRATGGPVRGDRRLRDGYGQSPAPVNRPSRFY